MAASPRSEHGPSRSANRISRQRRGKSSAERWRQGGGAGSDVRRRSISLALLTALVAMGLAMPVAPAIAQPGPPGANTDIVFSVDGSGSIDAVDFDTERRAIVAALQQSALFPVDGTVSVGVVQWAGGQTRIEVPLRRLVSPADVTAVTTGVSGMSQLGGGTNTGDGISAASQLLSGRSSGRQTICVTTDGVNNTGRSPADARVEAINAGVDRIAFATLEDRGAFRERDAVSAYGAIALDADVVHSLSPAEFSAVLPSTCLRPPITVVALEPNQGVQDWSTSVPLVENRDTVVRVFADPEAGSPGYPLGLRLRGFRGGAELPGSPLVATNAGGLVQLSPGVAGRRADPQASFNFRLPTDWRNGTVELSVDRVGTTATCTDAARPTSRDCSVQATFTKTSVPDMRFVGMPYRTGQSTSQPSTDDLIEQANRVYSAFPVSSFGYTIASLRTSFSSAPDTTDALSRLKLARLADGCFSLLSCKTLYLGVLTGGGGEGLAENIPGRVAVWYSGSTPYARNTGAHEIGHLLGRPHSVRGAATGTPPLKRGTCGEVADASAEDFPFFNDIGGSTIPTLGPLGNADTEAWGVDLRFFPSVPGLGVVNPRAVTEVMSYCSLTGDQGSWPSTHTWDSLLGTLSTLTVAPQLAALATPASYLLVQGLIDKVTGAVTFLPTTAVTATQVPDVPAGDFTLVQLDAAGQTLSEVPFAADKVDRRAGPNGQGPEPTKDLFALPVTANQALAKLEIRRAGQTLGVVTATASAPQVDITSPIEGQTVTGGLRVAWDASDADGNPLTYTVQYSPDDGLTWKTLSLLGDQRSLDIPEGELAGSDIGAIRVTASDGLRTATDLVRFLRVPNSAPTVDITTPADNDRFSGAQPIILKATAFDREDGQITNVQWTSDRDGALGAGAELTVLASNLAEGTHQITATATDSGGQVGRDTVTIAISRVAASTNTAPAAVNDTYTTAEDTPLTTPVPGVLGNDTDADGNPLTATLVIGPTNGTVTLNPDGSFTYTPAANYSGPDSFTYTAKDGTATSNTATVTIIVTPVNDAPVVTIAPGGSCGFNALSGTMNLALADIDNPTTGLTVAVASSNTALLPTRNVTLDGTGASRTLRATTAFLRTGTAVLTVTVSDGQASTTTPITVRAGTFGNDTLTGTPGADLMLGQHGFDTLSGLGGNDLLCGGTGGGDTLNGGDNDDTLIGGLGFDTLNGGPGNDRLTGGFGPDRFSGGPGTDVATDFNPLLGDTQDGTIP